MSGTADIQLDGEQVKVDGHLVTDVRVKWESLPDDPVAQAFYLPPKDTETDVALATVVSHILSLLTDTRERVGVRFKWESLPDDPVAQAFYLPPKDTETDVAPATVVSHILSLLMDTASWSGSRRGSGDGARSARASSSPAT